MGRLRVIAGRWRGRRLQVPAGAEVRPTSDRVREAWMSILGGALDGARVLDLFAGSGALGLEALSRGASRVTFVERAPRALRSLRANVEALGAGDLVSIAAEDVYGFLDRVGPRAFDIALADPPYGEGHARRLIDRFRAEPFAGMLCVEHRPDDELRLPPGAEDRSYGDTAIAFVPAPSNEEE